MVGQGGGERSEDPPVGLLDFLDAVSTYAPPIPFPTEARIVFAHLLNVGSCVL